MRQGAGVLVSSAENRFRGPCARSAGAPASHSGPLIAPLGLPQKGGFDSGVQVRRYAHDWNLVEPSLKRLSAKFRALLAA